MADWDLVRVRELLVAVIEARDFEGQGALLGQVPHVQVSGGPVTFLELALEGSPLASAFEQGPVPGQCWAYDSGQPIGTLLVWVEKGFLSALEYGWVTDRPPSQLPERAQLRFV